MNKVSFTQKILFFIALFLAISTTVSAQQIPVDEYMGVNTRRQDPINRMQAVGFIREYHDWYLNEGFPTIPFNEDGSPGYPNSQYRWNEAYQELTYTRYDDFYQEIQDSNIIICPTTLGNILQVIDPTEDIAFNHPNIGQILEQKPIPPGTDSLDPASYIAHAEYLYHYAARYGSTTFSPARANAIIAPKLHPEETLKTGLGNVTYLEDWNEQDKTYYPNFPKTYFAPAEYAAMLSADFDGDEQTLGLMTDPDSPNNMISTVGIKNADPNMKVVMGGLTDADLDYIREMVTWFKANRSANANFGQIPLDAINIHIYVGDNSQVLASTFGISPESAGIRTILQEFVAYRDSLMPETELWLSEFGYDTNDNSPISVPTIGNNDNYEVQGQWIVRFYLETIAAGFDRAILFDLRDICTQPACALFQSSGLLENLDSLYRPKNSWYYTYTMKNVLKGMNFDSDLSTCSDTTCTKVYRFIDPQNNNKKVYAVWSPTATDTSYQYQLSLEGANGGTLVEMELPSIHGIPSNISGQNPTITVGERPVFVVVGGDYLTPSPCIANLNAENITCSTARINWDTSGGAQQFQLWRQDGLITKADFSHRIAKIVDDEVDASTGTYTVADLAPSSNYTFFLIPQGVGISDITNYCSIQVTTGTASCKIPLDTSWIFDAYANRIHAYDLMDEQTAYDPICQTDSFPKTLWGVNFNDDGMERTSIDLQDYYYIDAITIHDASAIGELTIQIADSPNGPWTTIEKYQTIELDKWVTFTNSIPANKPVRYLRLIASDDDRALIGELFLCGRLSDFTADIAPGMARDVLVEGINCFSADLKWDHPFDKDISHYKVIFGNEVQLFPYTTPNQAVTISNLLPATNYAFSILTVDSLGQESDTLLINASTLPEGACDLGCNPSCPCQICLNPSWISAEASGNTIPVAYLVDEQTTVPICEVGGTPSTGWGWDFGSTTPTAILDLQQVYLIESFRIFDFNGIDNFVVEYKDDQGNWVLLFDYLTDDYNIWVTLDNLNVPARYLRMSGLNNNFSGARINEIAICGYPLCTGTETTELFETLCQGASIVFNDQTLTASGVYFDTLETANACDSFIVLNLSVFDTAHTLISHTICEGDSYYFNGQNLTTEGIYLATLTTTNACDSSIVLNLDVLQEGDACDDGNPNTNNDELDENCMCVGTGIDPNTCHVTVTLDGDNIKVENMIQPITKLDIYNENWSQVVYMCGNYNCSVDEIITGLPFGVYHVKVQAWTAGWAQLVCDLIVDVEIVDEDVPPTSDVCEVSVEVNGSTVAVNNLNQPVTILDVYNENWSQVVYHCGHDDCDANEVITGLADGIYHVKIQSYTANWAQIVCDTIIDIEIGMMPMFSCDVNIIAGNDFITINNLDEPLVSMFIFTGDYRQTLFRCSYGDCPTSKILTDLQPGAYVVKVQSYTNNFNEEICNFLQTVIVDESNNLCLTDNQTHLFGILKTGMYQAENAILSEGQVNQDTVVTFTAANTITLGSGFHANSGSSFTAMIDNCSDNTFTESIATSRTTEITNTILAADKFLKIAPNPFRNSTHIQYQLPNQTQQVSLFIYDMTGQIIQRPIRDTEQTKGFYSVDFQGDNLLSGMYYVALRIDGEVLIEKIAIVK